MEPVRCVNCQSLQRQVRDLQAENERLRRQLDEALRAGKRQAGPFAEDQPGDRYQQIDAAEARRLSYKELVARLMS
jgi:hypothetical protein